MLPHGTIASISPLYLGPLTKWLLHVYEYTRQVSLRLALEDLYLVEIHVPQLSFMLYEEVREALNIGRT